MIAAVPIETLIREHEIRLTDNQKRYLKLKRLVDVLISAVALAVLSPVFLVVACIIKLESPAEPVFFVQLRVGKNYKTFKLYKFRSMRTTAPKNLATWEFENPEQYITRFGAFIRRTSIDELPQLFNILKGDMSLIGPRPLVWTEREIRFLRRWYGIYQIRPGITGLAQINGRDTVDAYEKVKFDRQYLKNLGFKQDFKLFFKTVWVVLSRVGYREGKAVNHHEREKEWANR